jgi:hypothetical protein
LNLGILLCITCAGVHRTLGVQISKVRSLELDTDCWDRGQLDFMRQVGNVRARQIYEATCPCWYLRPTRDTTSPIVRENWIRAKYERHDFLLNPPSGQSLAISVMPEPPREGYLWKANKKGTWQKRYFTLFGRYLSYYKASADSYPKGIIDVCELTFALPNGPDGNKRFVFEAHTGSRAFPFGVDSAAEMLDWVHALKRAAAYYITLLNAEAAGAMAPGTVMTLNTASEDDKPLLSYQQMGTPIKMGTLSKQGGHWKSWNKRTCVLVDGMLYYFKKDKPAAGDIPGGGIPLARCAVADGSERAGKARCISLITPSRVYFLCAENDAERNEWFDALTRECDKLTGAQPTSFSEMPQPEPIRTNDAVIEDDSE